MNAHDPCSGEHRRSLTGLRGSEAILPWLRSGRRRFRILAAALMVPLGLYAVAERDDAMLPARTVGTPVLEFSPADLATAVLRNVTPAVAFTGSLAVVTQTTLTAPFDGKLVEISVRAGDRVEAGQVLARLNESDLAARLAELRAALASAEEQAALAERNRVSNLALLERNFISRTAFDNALGGHAEKRAAVQAQRARVAIAERALRDARITAPFPGVIASREAEPGQWVEPRHRLFTLVSLDRMELETTVSAEQLRSIVPGQAVEFSVGGFGSRVFAGRVARINPTARSSTRAVPVYVAVDNTDGALRAGLFASGRVLTGAVEEAVVLPTGALRQQDGQSGVWVIAGERLAWRPVQAGEADANHVRIRAGVQPGEQVVMAALLAPKAGQPVVVRR